MDIRNYVSELGLFKFKEKKAKQQELVEVMARIAELTKRNEGRAQQQAAVDTAQYAVDEAKRMLEEMRG